ncbi:Multidrug export protein EmrB [Vibrio aerogenes CECT 7868]|uniref:Multidrug export protein EmrB n=1 Tax=Vibrio aerogenes CECT 7868 TaxID=1216006 RepID=A0A1M5ZSU9_9VIBR|nr:MDR family MFS transporter [Vibrio aerogenes]SHI27385.1 Multidrug export protein EmrB [Vibrio aerogenes CECT 7868]
MSSDATQVVAARPEETPPVTARDWCIIAGGLMGGFMAILDIQITNVSMKVIQGALSATLNDSSWLITSYFTAEIVAIPLCGWLSKAFGTGRYALWCIGGFMLTSLLCSMAWSLNSMIIFRALQGFCGGALIPMSFRLIIEILPQEKRPVGMSMFSVIATFAPALGPALGGWLTDHFSWHFIFYINLVPGLISMGLIAGSVTHPKVQWQVIRQGDFLGIATASLCLGCLEVVLEKGREEYWFDSTMICVLTFISAVTFLIFIYDQLVYEQPLVNIRLLKDYHFSYGLVFFAILGAAVYGTLFLVPYYLTMVHDYNASEIGRVIIWLGFPQLVILPFIPILVRRVNVKYLILIGFTGLAASALMNSAMDAGFAGPQMKWSMLVRAIGQPFIMVPLSLLATKNIRREDGTSSAVLVNVVRSIGGSCGTAILSSHFVTRIHVHLAEVKTRLAEGEQAYYAYLHHVTELLYRHGVAVNAAEVQGTAAGILGNRMARQSEILAFNDMFFIMGMLMASAAVLVLVSDRNFRLFSRPAPVARKEQHDGSPVQTPNT